jgi:hypothetical protein
MNTKIMSLKFDNFYILLDSVWRGWHLSLLFLKTIMAKIQIRIIQKVE